MLKKDWRSHRCKLYPSGSTFRRNTEIQCSREGHWYDFRIPGESYGSVFIPNKVFFKLTDAEKRIKEERRALVQAHIDHYTRIL